MRTTVLKYIICILLASAVLIATVFAAGSFSSYKSTASQPITRRYSTVIIDAGHGGEDGGTSSRSGLIEKEINLSLAFILKEKLEAQGVVVVLTRDEDKLLYDRNVNYHGRKKKLDMAARLAIMQAQSDCIFISLHMNSFSDPKYSGLQVWYSDNAAESRELAGAIQDGIAVTLQPENKRKIKSAGTGIFLLDKATCPAILVECGFLSNVAEAARFESEKYRSELCECLCGCIISFLES